MDGAKGRNFCLGGRGGLGRNKEQINEPEKKDWGFFKNQGIEILSVSWACPSELLAKLVLEYQKKQGTDQLGSEGWITE